MTVVWHVDDAVTIDIVTKRDIPVTLPSVFASIVQSEILQKTPDLLTLSGLFQVQSHEVLDYASMKADILHIQTSLDKLTSLEQAPGIAELLCRKPTSPLVAFI
ncbi:hypothetical protein T09_5518 [Trichinella sp. T9]|nr:hypothetical protein T09_5518 [Trichinella sp. T9]